MTDPAAFDADTTPTIALAGRDWPVPELTWLQLKGCRRELIELNTRMNAAVAASPAEPDEDDMARGLRHLAVMAQVFDELDNDDFDRLVMGPIHAGLTVLHPALKRAELDGWRTTESERQFAWLAVRRQSGLFVFKADDPEPGAPGEINGAP